MYKLLKPDISNFLAAIAFIFGGLWLVLDHKIVFGWLAILFGCVGLWPAYSNLRFWYTQNKIRKASNKKELQELERLEKLANMTSVPDDPTEVWRLIMRDDKTGWVVFEHGTLVTVTDEQESSAKETALEEIEEYAKLLPGSDLGDFTVRLNEELGVWLVAYPKGNVFNYIPVKDCRNSGVAGFLAREIRTEDAEERNVIYVCQQA